MFRSYAQNGEDVVLWRALQHVEAGRYVDVGAADPDHDSVTRAFYDRGWSGIDVEPAPDHAGRLREARPRDLVVQACAGPEEGSMVLHHVVGTGLSSVVDDSRDLVDDPAFEVVELEVPVRRLDAMLESAGWTPDEPIHFLKVDVEGFEEAVLRGIDLSRWRPWVVVAESTKPRSTEQAHHGWEPILLDHGYRFCLFDGLNRFYVAAEQEHLADLLSFPASVFDQPFMSPPHAQLLDEYDNLLAGERRLQALYDGALASYEESNAELARTLESYRSLEATYEQTVADWRSLEATYLQTLADRDALDRTYHATLGELGALRAAHDDLLAAEATLRAGVAEMGASFDRIRAERDAARQELELTRQTLSWRVTRPLRAIRRLRAR